MAKRPYVIRVAPHPDALPDDASRTLIERTYLQLREDIVAGHLPPDAKLRVEHLKDRYEVGAGTLREAISRLVSDALVVAEGQRGFRVAPMTLAELEDLTELRVQVECEALRRSIRRGDPGWRDGVIAAWQALTGIEEPLQTRQARHWERLNARFHEALVAGCGSAWTLKVLRNLSQHSERYRRWAIDVQDSGRDVHAEHGQIVEYALSGQDARAALALEAHIRATPELLARLVRGGAPLPGAGSTDSRDAAA